MVSIPTWNALGLLPPMDPGVPTSPQRSPYPVSLKDFVMRFATTGERRAILDGFLKYRAMLHQHGVTEGFQWLDGSFLEEIEVLEKRAPRDLDVVSFIHGSLSEDADEYVQHDAAKQRFRVDSYFVEFDQIPPREIAQWSAYWYSMWSHRRNQAWKGFLQVELSPVEDAEAHAWLSQYQVGGPSDSI